MKNKNREILKAGFLAGTLDILAAFIYVYIKTGKLLIVGILKFIASGLFGKNAASGGNMMVLTGLVLHYIIAFSFTIFFFWLFPKIKFLSVNKILTAIIYGIFIWSVMNLIVVPLSNVASRPFNIVGAMINILILIVCLGIPITFIANRFYGRQRSIS